MLNKISFLSILQILKFFVFTSICHHNRIRSACKECIRSKNNQSQLEDEDPLILTLPLLGIIKAEPVQYMDLEDDLFCGSKKRKRDDDERIISLMKIKKEPL